MPDGSGEKRERLRFVAFDFQRLPDAHCRATVKLEWYPGADHTGSAQGLSSETGELRCAASATLQAIERAVDGSLHFDLLGVKSVRAFDAIVIIVSIISHHGDDSHRLVGSFLASDDSARGAAVAVLNATNRLLGNIFSRDAR
ncbi:MAG TPA: hypothetical protein VGA37_11220 [Gemmatimonadales bacterium]